ncbi:MAG: elongation factor P, partial [bacterium]|nr:elongation factor P [bacterium]
SVTELRKGTVFVEAGTPFAVLEYRHTKMGRGTANVRVKVRDLKSGATLEKTFISGASVEEGEVLKKKAQYLYSDDSGLHFMDPQTFEQFSVPAELGSGAAGFLKEGGEAAISYFENEPVAVEVPLKVDLKVIEAPPGNKGDTRQGGNKEVILETGYKVQAPLFVKEGDTIRVNTESGEYVGRA